MMALRHRLTLLAAGTVGVTVVLVCVAAYLVLRVELRGQVDDGLRRQFAALQRLPGAIDATPGEGFFVPPPRAGEATGPWQVISPGGDVYTPAHSLLRVPVDDEDRAIARGERGSDLRDIDANGLHLRVLTVPVRGLGALQLARSLREVDTTLTQLRLVFVLLCAAGTLLAAALGRIFGRQVIQPVSELTAAAEHITQTEDLGRRIEVPGDDEVGRMAQRFNTMLDTLEGSRRALDESVDAQRQLVADASHELRTPVTALRTNVEVLLAGAGELTADERRRVLEDVRAETEELSALITDVIELARGDEPPTNVEEVQLEALVAEAVVRARRRRPEARFETELEATVVDGLPDRLGRAVDNLLDNAAKYSPDGAVVEIVLRGGELSVRDHGPGIPASDRPHVFDRFYRGSGARDRPGSGLGLAIVRQVAQTHGGTIAVDEAPGGGALFRLRLPVLATGEAAGAPPEPAPAPPDAFSAPRAGPAPSPARPPTR
jgi:two-component system sensor histidine kinase MprB